MNEIIENEQVSGFDKMKEKLKNLLEGYLEERLNSKGENEKKQSFLDKFNSFGLKEKREYRDYLYQLMKSPSELKDSNDDLTQIKAVIESLKSIDKLEIYAGVCNNCKLGDSLQEIPNFSEYLGFETPSFIINSGVISINGEKIEVGSIGKNYMGNGNYQLFIDEVLEQKTIDELGLRKGVVGELPKSLIIRKDKVFAQDSLGTYEIKTLKISNKKIIIDIPGYGINITLNKMDI